MENMKKTEISTSLVKTEKEKINLKIEEAAIERETKLRNQIVEIALKNPIECVAEAITTIVKNEKQIKNFNYTISCFLHDGAYAVFKAIKTIYGYTSLGSDGPSSKPPETMMVTLPSGETLPVPWGKINLPMGDEAYLELGYNTSTRELLIKGQCESRYMTELDKIVKMARFFINKESIYKGKTISFENNNFHTPVFLDLNYLDNVDIVLNDNIEQVFRIIKEKIVNSERCIKNNISLKDVSLLTGTYGTGKTLKALQMGQLASKNGWTFIYLKKSNDISTLLKIVDMLSAKGQKICYLVEDMDTIFPKNEDNNEVINLLDDANSKERPIIGFYTTNHLDRVAKVAIRNNRISQIVNFEPLSSEKNEVLIKTLLKGELKGEIKESCEYLNEKLATPSFIVDVITKIRTTNLMLKEFEINDKTILNQIKNDIFQNELVKQESESSNPKEDLFNAFRDIFEETLQKYL